MAAATLTPPKPAKAKAKAKAQGAPAPVAPVAQSLAPMLGERQDQFFDRASRALRNIPVNRRTIQILDLWTQSQNDQDLRAKASAQFSPDKFQHFGPRCVFLEHTVPGDASIQRDEIRYDRKALQKLVDWANYRIRNTEQFAAISDGHTPSAEEKAAGCPMPDVLGYSGPFYLGLLGDVDPKWAIYADEWVHNEDLPRFQKLQRRSPEVWCSEPIERRTMDPIAALGAETPRLDSGMNPYSRVGDGRTVMRYSAAAGPAVMPGGMNTFIPSAGGASKRRPTKYGAEEMPPIPGQPGQPGQDQQPDISQAIAQAIQDLLPSIVQSVVQAIGAGDDDVPPDDGQDPGQDMQQDTPRGMEPDMSGQDDGQDVPGMGQDDPQGDPVQQQPQSAAQASPTPGAAPAPSPAPQDDDNDPEAKKYAAMGPDCHAAYQAGKRSGSMKYSRAAATNTEGLAVIVARQNKKLQQMQDDITRERRDVARYSRIADLSREFAFDPKEEAETVLDLTDAQFERHCTHTIAKYAKRGDVVGVELYDDPSSEPTRYAKPQRGAGAVNEQQIARYSREAASIAAEKNARKRGATTFEAEFDAICRQHGVSV